MNISKDLLLKLIHEKKNFEKKFIKKSSTFLKFLQMKTIKILLNLFKLSEENGFDGFIVSNTTKENFERHKGRNKWKN